MAEKFKTVREQLLKLHTDHNLPLRPYVVINGPSLSEIKSAYVILDDVVYQVTTTLSAMEILFESMKVFGKTYPRLCNHVWQYLEKAVYGFEVIDTFAVVSQLTEQVSSIKS